MHIEASLFFPNRKYLGFSWIVDGHETVFQDNMLCFGLKSAPSIFNSISSLVVRYANAHDVQVIGYLVDFYVASESLAGCTKKQEFVIEFLQKIGFDINFKKVSPPSQQQKYLGIIVDLRTMVFCLPEEKLAKASSLVASTLAQTWSSYKKLEKLAGYLAHCATLIKGGRTFCKCLYGLLKAAKGKRRVWLSEVMIQDLKWWQAFNRIFDGTVPITHPCAPQHIFYTDASSTGFGAWWDSDFLYGYWDTTGPRCSHFLQPPTFDSLKMSNINVKVLWPVVASIKKWGPHWRN